MNDVDARSLNTRFAHGNQVQFVAGPAQIPHVLLDHEGSTASVALHGGHVLHYTPRGAAPVLWMSREAIYRTGKALRGGVPVCWPWFGPHPTDATLPAHGFARTNVWRVAETAADAGVQLLLELDNSLAAPPFWPYAYQLSLRVTLDDALHIALTTTNTGNEPFAVTAALHSYFAVGDIARTRIDGFAGVRYLDQLTGETATQHGPITFEGEVDRIYQETTAACTIVDPVQGRAITIDRAGSRSAVVWNPWIEKARRLADFGDDEYTAMVCIEAANVGDDQIALEPGASHTLTTSISVARHE